MKSYLQSPARQTQLIRQEYRLIVPIRVDSCRLADSITFGIRVDRHFTVYREPGSRNPNQFNVRRE